MPAIVLLTHNPAHKTPSKPACDGWAPTNSVGFLNHGPSAPAQLVSAREAPEP